MQISIANAIQVARRIGAAAAEVITTNLKMWLGFETSETLGTEEVVNGGFVTDLSNWSIANSDSTHTVTHTSNGARFKSDTTSPLLTFTSDTANIVSGRSYEIKVVISEYQGSSGIKIQNSATGNVNYSFDSVDTFTYSFTAVSNSSNPIQFYRNGANVDITIESVSLKELIQITPDKSGNNNVGELFTGKALDFNGSTDNVGFTFTTPVKSAVFWVKPLGTGLENILTFGGAFAGTKSIRSNINVISSLGLSSVSVYVNGVQSSSVPLNQWSRVVVNFASVTPSQLKFGFAFNSYGDIQLSDVQLYNENLTTDDIAYDYANPQNLVTDRSGTSIGLSNLKGYWHLSEGAGSIAYDSSGEGNDGTISGATYEPAQPRIPQLGMMNFSNGAVATGVTLIPDPNNISQDILGNAVRDRLNSFNLDGSGYAEVADDTDLDLGTGAFSFDGWAKYAFVNQGSSINTIYTHFENSSTTGFSLNTETGGVLSAWFNGVELELSAGLSEGDWFYFALTRDASGNVKLYASTDLENPATTTQNPIISLTNAANKRVGGDALTTRHYNNLISDLRLYDTDLSSNEVKNNYNAGLSAHTN